MVNHLHDLVDLTRLQAVRQRADRVPELELGEEAGPVGVKLLEPALWSFARFL